MTTPHDAVATILLTGASGYIGQHLLWYWMKGGLSSGEETVTVVALYCQSADFVESIQRANSKVVVVPICCNLTDSSSVDTLFRQYSFDVCVHTAALSSPALCQQQPDKAREINVPEYFLQKLQSVRQVIAFSTDQVFDGTNNSPYQEVIDIPNPLNVYGKTKMEMETCLRSHPRCVILRSSIILGPHAPLSKAHDTFMHFCATRQGQETTFFTNEYRSVVSVQHVCRIVDYFVNNPISSTIFHMGGPLQVNRLQMARAVFDYLGYDPSVLVPDIQTSPTSPLDITMDSSRLEKVTKIVHQPTTLQKFVEYVFKQ